MGWEDLAEQGSSTTTTGVHQAMVLLLERRKPTGNRGERPKNTTVLTGRKLLEKEKSRSARNMPSGLHDFRTALQKSLLWLNTSFLVNSSNTWLLCKQSRSEHEQRVVMLHSFFRK